MKLDNSQLLAFTTCPLKWYERHIQHIQKDMTWTAFGTRWHELLEERMRELGGLDGDRNYAPSQDQELENEAQAMFAAYCANYPVEPFDIIAVESVFELSIPGSTHTYRGKFDAIVRNKEYNWLQVFETKSEKRNSKRNHPKAWNARTQASLYLWAARQIYEEPVNSILLNVCTRGSEGGKVGPSFRRDILERNNEQIQEALNALTWVADQIETCTKTGYFPRFTESCMEGPYECEYYSLHNIADSPEMRTQYSPTEDYLSL